MILGEEANDTNGKKRILSTMMLIKLDRYMEKNEARYLSLSLHN